MRFIPQSQQAVFRTTVVAFLATAFVAAFAVAVPVAASRSHPVARGAHAPVASRTAAAEATRSGADLDAIAQLASERMRTYGIPGVALGVLHNGVMSTRTLGVVSVDDSVPINAHTVFPIASISKTFAATAMVRLVEAGRVDLDAPVRHDLPDFRVRDSIASRSVTVRELLTHLSGWEGQVSGPDRGAETLRNFVSSIGDLMQVAPPRAAWSYNNAGFSVAGRVIESVTGTSIHRAMDSLVFRPLGLMHAGTSAGDFITSRFAVGHTVRNGRAVLLRPFAASVSVTAGGIGLCIEDLMAYAQFHLGDGRVNGATVLSAATLRALRTPQAAKHSTDDAIGLAWHLRTMTTPTGTVRTASHGGTLGGHILLLELVPERNFAIAILTNADAGWRLIQDVERAALEQFVGAKYTANQAIAHRGKRETLPNTQPLSPQPSFAPYVGTYRRPTNAVSVRVDGARLIVQEQSDGRAPSAEMPIAFFGVDRAVVTDGAARGQSIEFVRDASGSVEWVRVVGRIAVRLREGSAR